MLKLSLSRMVVIIVFKECLGVLNSGKDYSFMLQALSFELVWRLLFRFFFFLSGLFVKQGRLEIPKSQTSLVSRFTL